jgi:hypothetical protein
MIYKLHYAKLGLKEDIPCIQFNDISDICNFIEEIENKESAPYLGFAKNKVFVLTDGSEVIVTQSYNVIQDFFIYEIFALFEEDNLNNIHLFEKESYQEAYDLALLIKTNFE